MKAKIILYLFGVFLTLTCSPKITTNAVSRNSTILFPEEADTAYFQFITGLGASTDIGAKSKFTEAITGKNEFIPIIKPYGIAVEKNKVYISDIGIAGLNIIDWKNASFSQFKPSSRDLQFVLASFIDTNNDRYLMDTKSSKVVVYNENGNFISKFDISESERPTDIFIKNDKIYIAAFKSGRINIYDKTSHELIDYFPKNVSKDDEAFLYQPIDLCLTDEYIYVVDAGAFKVKLYDYNGKFVKSIGAGLGMGPGQFNRPKSVAVDKEGIIYVSDSTFGNIQVFDYEGQLLMYFGSGRNDFTGLMLPTSIAIDYNNLEYFESKVDPNYKLKYLIYVVSQQGKRKLSVFGRIERK